MNKCGRLTMDAFNVDATRREYERKKSGKDERSEYFQ